MGLTNFIAQKYGIGIVMDTLNEKFPPLVTFIDSLDEASLPSALANFSDAYQKLLEEQSVWSGRKITVKEVDDKLATTINWPLYRRRFLTETPFINPLIDFLKDLGIFEVLEIKVEDFVRGLAAFKNKK